MVGIWISGSCDPFLYCNLCFLDHTKSFTYNIYLQIPIGSKWKCNICIEYFQKFIGCNIQKLVTTYK